MEFKDRIKLLRKEHCMSQSQLAKLLNKSESAVGAWELNRSKPDADTLIILSEYFKCTTDYLLGLSDVKNQDEKNEFDIHNNRIKNMLSQIPNGNTLLKDLDFFLVKAKDNDIREVVIEYFTLARILANLHDYVYKIRKSSKKSKSIDSKYLAYFLYDAHVCSDDVMDSAKKMVAYSLSWLNEHDFNSDEDKKRVQQLLRYLQLR